MQWGQAVLSLLFPRGDKELVVLGASVNACPLRLVVFCPFGANKVKIVRNLRWLAGFRIDLPCLELRILESC